MPEKTEEATRKSIESSIKKLGGVPDLYLIHNPFPKQPELLLPTWKVLEDMKDEGRLKSIGVSNFRPQDFERLLANCRHKPVAHQVGMHAEISQSWANTYSTVSSSSTLSF